MGIWHSFTRFQRRSRLHPNPLNLDHQQADRCDSNSDTSLLCLHFNSDFDFQLQDLNEHIKTAEKYDKNR